MQSDVGAAPARVAVLGLRIGRRRIRGAAGGWGFVSPAVIFLLALTTFPFVFSLVLTFSNVDITAGLAVHPGTWANWTQLFADSQFWSSVTTTVTFVVVAVVAEFVFGFGLAYILWHDIRGGILFRVLFVIPMMLAPAAIGFMFRMLYNENIGPLNSILGHLGLPGVPWLSSVHLALYSIVIVDVWEWTPFVMLLLLAGLQAMPIDVLEAAALDGAGRWQTIRSVILPILAPLVTVVILLRMIEAFKVFGRVLIMTGGGPGTSTQTATLYAYFTGLNNFNLSYGSTIAVSLLVLVTIVATVYLFVARRLVGETG
jgi:multiple sugar transport system permease protein